MRCIWSRAWLIFVAGWTLVACMAAEEKAPLEPMGVIRQAISEKGVLAFVYHGHERTVEPHAVGKTTDGKPALLGWQTEGGSNTEPPPGWRTFLLGEITVLKRTGKTFETPRGDYRTQNRTLKTVDAEVTP